VERENDELKADETAEAQRLAALIGELLRPALAEIRGEIQEMRAASIQIRRDVDEADAAARIAAGSAAMTLDAMDEEASRAETSPARQFVAPTKDQFGQILSVIEKTRGPGAGTGRHTPIGVPKEAETEWLGVLYDALLTGLGRRDKASIVLYQRIDARSRTNSDGEWDAIKILSGVVGASDSIAVYGHEPGGPVGLIGSAPYATGRDVVIPNLDSQLHIDILQILDYDGRPIRLGRPADLADAHDRDH
jgi:hypothetical protein